MLMCFVFLVPFVIELVLYPSGPFRLWVLSFENIGVSFAELYLSIYIAMLLVIIGAFLFCYIIHINSDSEESKMSDEETNFS